MQQCKKRSSSASIRSWLRYETLEDRLAPAYLELLSGPLLQKTGWAQGNIYADYDPDAGTLDWNIAADVTPPAGHEWGGDGTGRAVADGNIVVRVVPEQGDVPGQPVQVHIGWEQDYYFDLDPGLNRGGGNRNGFEINGELLGVGNLPTTPGGRGDFNQQNGHEGPGSWNTAGTNGFTHFGDGSFGATVGGTFAVHIRSVAFSDGVWYGGTDIHGEVGINVRLHFQLTSEDPNIRGEFTQSRPALIWNNEGGIDLYYKTEGVPLPPVEAAFYWGRYSEPGNPTSGVIRMGSPFAVRELDTTNFNPDPIRLAGSQIPTPPANAAVVVAALDYRDQIAESNEFDNEEILGLDSDLAVRAFYYTEGGDARLEYTLAGRPQPGGVVEFYWATGTGNGNIINPGNPLLRREVDGQIGQHQVTVSSLLLANPPAEATHLFAWIDRERVVDESNRDNNTAALGPADLQASGLYYNGRYTPGQRGIDFSYTIQSVDPAAPIEVAYYWATGTTIDTAIGGPIVTRTLQYMTSGATGTMNEPARWGIPPTEARYILAVFDPSDRVEESDEDNNVSALELHSRDEILNGEYSSLVPVLSGGSQITIYFNPKAGSEPGNISEAEIRFGVDHFNWYQQIVSVPDHWNMFHLYSPPGSEEMLVQQMDLPWVDPDYFMGSNANEFSIVSDEAGRGERMASLTHDRKPFYWDEPGEVQEYTTYQYLMLTDTPRFPADFLQPGELVGFKTWLVGVSYGGEMTFLPGAARPVEWFTNATYDQAGNYQGGILLKVPQDWGDLPPVVAGGVINGFLSEAPCFTGLGDDTGRAGDRNTSDNTLVLRGWAMPGVTVTLSRQGVGPIGQAIADAGGVWSFDYSATPLPDGTHVFTATDDQNRTSELFAVTVDTAPPADLALFGGAVAENQPAGAVVGTFDTSDHRGRLFTYRLVAGTGGDDNAAFAIDGDQLVLAGPLDFEARSTYHVRVRAESANGLGLERAFTVEITDVYEGPSNLQLSGATVEAGQPGGTLVGTLDVTAISGFVGYALVPGEGADDNPEFFVSGDRLYTAGPLTQAAGTTRTVRVMAVDALGLKVEQSFTITVTSDPTGNTPPTISDVTDQTVPANGTSEAITFTVSDAQTAAGSLQVTASSSNTTLLPRDGIILSGSGANRTVTLAPAAGQTGSVTVTLTVTDAGGLIDTDTFTLTVTSSSTSPPPPPPEPPLPPPPPVPVRPALVVGGLPDGLAAAFAASPDGLYGVSVVTFTPFPGFAGQIRTATADVDADTIPDTVLVTGPGTPIRFAVVSGADNTTLLIAPTAPFAGSEDFIGGGFVAAADLDGDGKAEIAVTPDQGGGPRVTIFSLLASGLTVRANFFGIDDPSFRGGARAALGDVNADGTPDLAVSAGFLGGPRTAIFDGQTLLATPTRLVTDFFAFPGEDATRLRNGVFVSIGDMNGDGFGDLVFGGGPGGAPRVFVLSGQLVSAGNVAGAQAAPVANFFVAGNDQDRGGVRVAAKDADGDSKADLVTGSGEGSPANIRIYLGRDFTSVAEPTAFQDIGLFGGAPFAGGVFVG